MRLKALAAILLAAGCATPAAGSAIDGFEIGTRVPCAFQENDFCERFLTVARKGFDDRDTGHLPVVESTLYEPAELVVRSGGPIYVAVFKLADGSLRAVGVGNVGITGPVPWDAPDRPRYPGATM